MTKIDDFDNQINQTTELGERNKALIPKVRNWCKNIKVEDKSSGLFYLQTGLPIHLSISCPHTPARTEAANLEWIAEDFVINCCRSCNFHSEIHQANFGREVITRYEKEQEEQKQIEQDRNQGKQKIKQRIQSLIDKKTHQTGTTELSILKLIQKIDTGENNKKVAAKILEASQLSPHFFGETSLDYLSTFFSNEEIGEEVLKSIANILQKEQTLSASAFKKLSKTIGEGFFVDQTAQVLKIIKPGINLQEYQPLIESILDHLWYKRQVGDPADSRPSYPHAISLLIGEYKERPEMMQEMLEERLRINNKTTRININYLLQELLKVNPEMVIIHCPTLIHSLELKDDTYEESADYITCLTLSQLYEFHPRTVANHMIALYTSLTPGAKVEMLTFFRIILLKDDLALKYVDFTNHIIKILIEILPKEGILKELKNGAFSVIVKVSDHKPELLVNYVKAFTGFLTQQIKEQKTFNWYRKELEKPKNQISTFNPLQGRHYVEIESERIDIQTFISKLGEIIQNLLKSDQIKGEVETITDMINNLSSASDGELKSKLIKVLKNSVKEPLQLAKLLPSIYTFLLDKDSKLVRYEAVRFVADIIQHHDQLITQNILDLLKVFMSSDSENLVRGAAVKAFGDIIIKFPEQVGEEEINTIIDAVGDKSVFIAKRAADLSNKLSPYLSKLQLQGLLTNLLILEQHYFSKQEYREGRELINILLFLAKEEQNLYVKLVNTLIVKYCRSGDYYTEKDFLQYLTIICKQNAKFNALWLEESLDFIYRTHPNIHNYSFDIRHKLFTTIYTLPQALIESNLDKIHKLIVWKIQQKDFLDVFELFGILGYFRQYEKLKELSEHLKDNVEDNKSNKWYLSTNASYKKIADLELAVKQQSIDNAFIKSLLNQ